MTSINPAINELHQAFLEATAFELELNIVLERYWFEAIKWNFKPDDIKLVLKARIRGIAKGERREASILPRNICGSEEALAQVSEELAAIKSRMRMKVLPLGKQDVLKATGRSAEPETRTAQHVGDNELIKQLREAAS